MQASEIWKVIQLLRLNDLRTHWDDDDDVCVFFAQAASENLKTKDRVCRHVGEPGSPLNVKHKGKVYPIQATKGLEGE
jgi:hypothetical protein